MVGHPVLAGGPANPAQALLVLFVLSIVFSIGIGGVLNFVYPISPHYAREFLRPFGIWGPLGIVVIVAVLIVAVPVPTIPFDIAADLGLGALQGSIYILLGHLIGAAVGIALPAFGIVSVGAELTGHPLRAALIVGTFGLLAGAAYFFFGRPAPGRGATPDR